MKSMFLLTIAMVACLVNLNPAHAQTSQDRGSAELCKALESYVAIVDAAKSQVDAAHRMKKYDEAKTQLEPVLKRNDKIAVMKDAEQYATFTEQISGKDATDPQLPDIIEKALQLRTKLLNICPQYSTN